MRYETFEQFRQCGDVDSRIVERYISAGDAELAAMAAFYAARHNMLQEAIERNAESLRRLGGDVPNIAENIL